MPIASPERHGDTPRRSSAAAAGNRTTASSESLLTPRDILTRLNMTRADPAKWMRRTFTKHGVPYIHACGKMRATEVQYMLLLEKITCSPSGTVGRGIYYIRGSVTLGDKHIDDKEFGSGTSNADAESRLMAEYETKRGIS